jgi:uncharacterized membrane protein
MPKDRSLSQHSFIKSWKIWLPLGMILLVVTLLALFFILLSAKDNEGFSLWATIAMVFLIFLTLVSSLVTLLLIIFASFAARALYKKTAAVIGGTQRQAGRINHFLRSASRIALVPFLLADQIGAVLGTIIKKGKESRGQ